jgi:hypothetical protein
MADCLVLCTKQGVLRTKLKKIMRINYNSSRE